MHQMTAKALKDRSENAIRRLRYWNAHLSREMRTQRPPDISVPHKGSKYIDEPNPETITLKWVDVENLTVELRAIADELQKFTK